MKVQSAVGLLHITPRLSMTGFSIVTCVSRRSLTDVSDLILFLFCLICFNR